MDANAAKAIEALDPNGLAYEHACGRAPVAGMLLAARNHGLRVKALDLRSSGDTAGRRDSVVGYGAWALYKV
jgi:AmmeMemoRadiSam system protein B